MSTYTNKHEKNIFTNINFLCKLLQKIQTEKQQQYKDNCQYFLMAACVCMEICIRAFVFNAQKYTINFKIIYNIICVCILLKDKSDIKANINNTSTKTRKSTFA